MASSDDTIMSDPGSVESGTLSGGSAEAPSKPETVFKKPAFAPPKFSEPSKARDEELKRQAAESE